MRLAGLSSSSTAPPQSGHVTVIRAPALRFAPAILACLAASPAVAAGLAGNRPAVVIAAAPFPQTLAQTLPGVSALTRAQIEQSGVKNLTTLLQQIAGAQITSSGGPGRPATTGLEGFGGVDARVLVLLHGLPVTPQDASGGSNYLENLITDQIQRIAVIHGNVAATWGSGAIGGLILITTRGGSRTPQADVSLSAGSRNTATVSANASGQIGKTRLQAGISRYTTSGFPSINPAQSTFVTSNQPDGYHKLTASSSLVQQLGRHQQLGARAFLSDVRYTQDNHTAGGRTK